MILVVGATGILGGQVVRRLLAEGKEVRILVRPNSPSAELAPMGLATSAEELIVAGAEPAYGDLTMRGSLDDALVGVDTVITTATATARLATDTIRGVDQLGMLSLVDAARFAGVSRFVFTSIQGAHPDSPNELFRYKGQVEEALKQSGMIYIILQPTIFMEVWIGMVVGIPLMAGQPISLIGEGNHAHNFIAVGDVANYLVTVSADSHADRQSIEVGGPASYNWIEIVELVGNHMGQTLPINYLPMGSTLPMLPPGANPLINFMETFSDEMDVSPVAETYGIMPTPVEEVIAHMF